MHVQCLHSLANHRNFTLASHFVPHQFHYPESVFYFISFSFSLFYCFLILFLVFLFLLSLLSPKSGSSHIGFDVTSRFHSHSAVLWYLPPPTTTQSTEPLTLFAQAVLTSQRRSHNSLVAQSELIRDNNLVCLPARFTSEITQHILF